MDVPIHDSPYDELLAVAVRAAQRGADIIRDATGRLGRLDDRAVRSKGVNDFVTETDEAAQAAIVTELRKADPGISVLAEEGDVGGAPAKLVERRWIVDPIDGTTNFIQQVPPYAVSIGLQEGEFLAVAVVLDVPHDELFTAVVDHGLQVNGQPAGVTDVSDLGSAFVATGFPYRRFEHTDVYLDVLGDVLRATRGVRRHGAASVDLARLACGRFDVFFETGLQPWDVAAGTLLIREGGGAVTDYRGEGGLIPVFTRQVCATSGPIHPDVLDLLAPMRDVRL